MEVTAKQIRKEVTRRYPKTEKERQGCVLEIERMKGIRNEYRKRLEQTSNSEAKRNHPAEV